jgi:GGDEF domain-containing protein
MRRLKRVERPKEKRQVPKLLRIQISGDKLPVPGIFRVLAPFSNSCLHITLFLIMEITPKLFAEIYFENDGEFDLLTGAIAPNRFNQIIDREVKLSKRNLENLAIISVSLDLNSVKSIEKSEQILEIESQLIQTHFKIQSLLREIDCIGRVSTLGFWVFIKVRTISDSSKLVNRIKDLVPDNLIFSIIDYTQGESQLQWYERIDKEHFQ